MKSSLRIKWRNALESREYAQGEVALCQEGAQEDAPKRWCCLGVLLDVVDPDSWECNPKSGWPARLEHPLKKGESEYLSNEGLEKVGLTMNQQKALAVLNDEGVPFKIIARSIDALLAEDEFAQDELPKT